MAVWDPLGITTGTPDYGQLFGGVFGFLGEELTGGAGQESGSGGVITPSTGGSSSGAGIFGQILGMVQQIVPLVLIGLAIYLLVKYGAKLLK